MAVMVSKRISNNYIYKILRSALGGFVSGLGTVFVMRSGLGYSCWDVLYAGISAHTGILIGNMSIIISLVLIAIDFFLKESVGIGTFIGIIASGKSVDLFMSLIPDFQFPHFILYYLTMTGGMFIIAFGVYIYLGAGIGTGARDGIMVAIRRHLKIPIGVSRFALEALAGGIGWLLGGPVGPATFIMAATLGLAIQVVFKLIRFEAVSVQHDNLRDTIRRAKDYIESQRNRSGQ